LSAPHCLVVGTGRMAGGFVAPLLRDAGWTLTLVGRDNAVVDAINRGGIRVAIGAADEVRLSGVDATTTGDPDLGRRVAAADLLATAVGPTALEAVGAMLAPLLRRRLDRSPAPVNIVTFENHRRAPELLMAGLLAAEPSLAVEIGRTVGIGGAAVWRIISERSVTGDGVRYAANAEHECFGDAVSLLAGAAPSDGSVPGMALVHAFDDRMVEKLWLFNAGHSAAAYLGWHAGAATVDRAMALPDVAAAVEAVVREARDGLDAYLARRPGSLPLTRRPVEDILACYADPALRDAVARVAREPRRKLAFDDRLIGPAVACATDGAGPVALASVVAAVLAYAEPADEQARTLRQEVALVGPAEVLATVCGLHPADELSGLICDRYRQRDESAVAS